MANPVVRKYAPDTALEFPITSGGTALVDGQFMKRGTTPGTQNGMLIAATGNASHRHIFGTLSGTLVATTLDTDTAGTIFTTRPINLIDELRVVRMEYSQAAADDIAATQAVTTTTITLTSLEDNIDAAFLYVVLGAGAGQTNFLTASADGSATLKAAFGTSLDTSSTIIKILPRFHLTASMNAAGTRLSSQAGVGSWTQIMILDTFIVRNGNEQQMNPTRHDALTGLNSVTSLKFEADVIIHDSFAHPLS